MNIGEIARRANVSTATVSRTLNQSGPVKAGDRAQGLARVAELNYYPNSHARALVSGRSRLLGLIVSDITNPFFPELIRSFEALATQQRYDLILTSTDYQTARMTGCVRRMLERKVDGVAIMTSEMDLGLIKELVAPRRADRLHGRRPGRAAHEPRLDRLRQRHPAGRRSRRRARAQAHRVHHRPARSALGAHAAAGVPRRHARSTASSPTRSWFAKARTPPKAASRRWRRSSAAPAARPRSSARTTGRRSARCTRSHAAGLRVPEDISIVGFDDIPLAQLHAVRR